MLDAANSYNKQSHQMKQNLGDERNKVAGCETDGRIPTTAVHHPRQTNQHYYCHTTAVPSCLHAANMSCSLLENQKLQS